jgi:hypothetical protein
VCPVGALDRVGLEEGTKPWHGQRAAAQQGAAARGSDREETDRWATGGGRGLKLMSRPGCI